MAWREGSSVSGTGYGYAVQHGEGEDAGRVRLLLCVGGPFIGMVSGRAARVFEGPRAYQDAHGHGEAFARCWQKWRAVQERARLLASGFAVVGGW
jgi:hypothetical protein